MPNMPDQRLLDALLDSWDRNDTILLNLLRALPHGGLEVRAMEGSPVRRAIHNLAQRLHIAPLRNCPTGTAGA